MTTLERNNLLAVREITAKRKCRVRNVVPTSARSSFQNYNNCFLGFSLENHQFENPKLDAMIRWIDARFESCILLMGDSIHGLTIQINKNIDEASAFEEAIVITRQTVKRVKSIIEENQNSCDFTIMLCSDIQKRPEYDMYYRQLDNLFRANEEFAASVMNFAQNFILRKDLSNLPRCVALSVRYILEESAICACLKKSGYDVLIYPGSLTILQDISSRQFDGAPSELKDLVNISLDFK